MKKLKKIDVFFDGHYQHSTCFYQRCKDAKESALKNWKLSVDRDNQGYSRQTIANYTLFINNPDKVKAFFDKEYLK